MRHLVCRVPVRLPRHDKHRAVRHAKVSTSLASTRPQAKHPSCAERDCYNRCVRHEPNSAIAMRPYIVSPRAIVPIQNKPVQTSVYGRSRPRQKRLEDRRDWQRDVHVSGVCVVATVGLLPSRKRYHLCRERLPHRVEHVRMQIPQLFKTQTCKAPEFRRQRRRKQIVTEGHVSRHVGTNATQPYLLVGRLTHDPGPAL